MSHNAIGTVHSADLVTFKVFISGKALPEKYQVLNITVDKELNRIPMAKIMLMQEEPSTEDFKLSSKELLIPGNEIEIKAGYNGRDCVIFKGIIIGHSLKIRSKQSNLIIECKDKAVKLTVGRKSKYFFNSKDSEIIKEIINNYDLKSEIEDTSVTHKEMVQYNVSDWDFLVTRAQANGKVCIVDDGKILIKRPDIEQVPIETITFGDTMLEFDAEIDARNQFEKITTYGWDASKQELLEAEAEDSHINLNGNLKTSDLSKVIELENLQLKNGGNNLASLQNWANSKAMFNQLSKIRGRVQFQGLSKVKPDTLLILEGVGSRFNGKVYVSGVRHQIADGSWTVDAQFGVNPKWFSETFEINDLPAAGLMAAVKGLQIGIVTQLKGDPEKEERILVNLPIVDQTNKGTWARVATLDAGSNRGSFFRPEIGDEVIVGFINDNPNEAVVLGMMNSSAKPAPLTASDDNHEKGFITRSEIKLLFNDDEKSIKIETPGGRKVIMNDDEGEIYIEDKSGNKIIFDSDGITCESPKNINIKANGDVSIEGMNVSLKADAQFKAEGSAGAEVSTGAVAVIKGSVVQIN